MKNQEQLNTSNIAAKHVKSFFIYLYKIILYYNKQTNSHLPIITYFIGISTLTFKICHGFDISQLKTTNYICWLQELKEKHANKSNYVNFYTREIYYIYKYCRSLIVCAPNIRCNFNRPLKSVIASYGWSHVAKLIYI